MEDTERSSRRVARRAALPKDLPPRPPTLPSTADGPHWLPQGPYWDRLPEAIKWAAREILSPAYRQLVVEAPDELQRSTGMTLVHLMWLEICDQIHMAQSVADRESAFAIADPPDRAMEKHLPLVAAKCQVSELLLKLRLFCHMQQSVAAPPTPLAIPERSVPPFAPLPPAAGVVLDVPAADGPLSNKGPDFGKSQI